MSITSLEGKRAIFIGNSFIYYGNCVTGGTSGTREDDKGYFYRLAESNGEHISVYNMTYGGRNLRWIYENILLALEKDFFDRFDFVFLSEAGENNQNFMRDIKNINALFENARIFYLCHEYTHFKSHTNILSSFEKLREEGITLLDWGGLVCRIINGEELEGSKEIYTRQSFIKYNVGKENGAGAIGEGKKGDGHHQNPLSGYICALMAYCAASGRDPRKQGHAFCFDSSLHPYFNLENFVNAHYNAGLSTNMLDIFRSEEEMTALKRLVYNTLK